MLKIKINKKDIEIVENDFFVRGTVGAKVGITFDSSWGDTFNTVVFKRVGITPINIIVNELETTIDIPHEILSESGTFKIGVFGTAENIVTPTLWSDEIKVRYGTDTNGTEPTDYTPSEIEQIKNEINNKQNTLIAGKNITIENSIISSTTSGEKWEKIVDTTIEEECISFKTETDLSGNPFVLKKAYFLMKLTPITTSNNVAIVFNANKDAAQSLWGREMFAISRALYQENAKYGYSYAFIEQVQNNVVVLENRMYVNADTIPDTTIAYGQAYSRLAINEANTKNKKINALYVGSYAVCLGVGTKIEMWGVRE